MAGGQFSKNAFRITPEGVIAGIIDPTGDGAGSPLNSPVGIAVDSVGHAYVTGSGSDNAFRISGVAAVVPVPALSHSGLTLLGVAILCAAWWLSPSTKSGWRAKRPRAARDRSPA